MYIDAGTDSRSQLSIRSVNNAWLTQTDHSEVRNIEITTTIICIGRNDFFYENKNEIEKKAKRNFLWMDRSEEVNGMNLSSIIISKLNGHLRDNVCLSWLNFR